MKEISRVKLMTAAILLLIMQPAFRLFAQEYRFAHIDAQQGLSNNDVKVVYRDKTGFLWIGTAFGLNRFDGSSVRVFRSEPSDSTSLFYDDVSSLFEIPGNKMGVLTTFGLCVYDPATETFSRDLRFLHKFSISNPAGIKGIVHDNVDNYWFLIDNGGLICYNSRNGKTILAKHTANDSTTISTDNVTSLARHADGSYWIAHSNGIVENLAFVGDHLEVKKRLTFFYDRASTKGMPVSLQCAFIIDRDGDLWCYSHDLGAFYFDIRHDRVYPLNKNSGETNRTSNLVTGIVQDNKGYIWIATGLDGIDVLDKKTFAIKNISHSSDNDNTLSGNSISTLSKDRDGIIWVGTHKAGLNYFHENIMRFHLINKHSKPYGLPYEDVNAFAEDKNGNLWLGTNGGGLIYYDRHTNKFTRYRHDPRDPGSLSNDVIVSVLIDHDDKLWIGTFLGGLNYFDGQKFTRYQNDPSNPNSFSGRSAWEVFEDSQKRLWIGTLDGGLNLFNWHTKTFTHFDHPGRRALYSGYVPTILEDLEGNIWFGTSLGIDVLMKASGQIVHFESAKNNPATLGNNVVLGILQDAKKRIWIATFGGLSVWQKETNRFINFTEKNGLPHNVIMSMLEDEDGRLWLGTPNGLSCATITPKGDSVLVNFKNYSEVDGLQSKQFNEDAAIKTRSGELVFGGPNGFNIFRPHDISQNKIAPQLVFTDFQLFNRSVRPGRVVDDGFTLRASITTNPPVVLKAADNVFSIEFAALNFIQPSKTKYRYMLEGFNKDWLAADENNRKVTFTNLNAGSYTFRVIAGNEDDVWTKEGISLHIKVLPPFWKSWKAYVLYLLVLVLLLFITRRTIQQREKLKFSIRQQQEEVRRSRELDMMKTKFFTNVSHELRTPLSLILAPLDHLREEAANAEQGKHFDLIQRNAKRLLNLVNQLLDFRKMEVHNILFRPSEGDIVRFVRDTVYSFSDLSEKKDIRLTFEANVPSMEAIFDHDKVEKILFNLLSNAFKFTMANGEILVSLEVKDSGQNGTIEIRVKDTGIGIHREKHAMIFERFFQNEVPNSVLNQGSGIGLAITKEFVRIHGGTISVESEAGKGSCFIVVLPLKKLSDSIYEVISQPATQVLIENVAMEHEKEFEPGSREKPTVLLVEDSEDFRFYLKDNLKTSYNVVEATNGNDGWEKVLAHSPDLVVSDVIMPGMTGLELCKKIKSDQRVSHIPVILLTARSGEEQRLEGFEMKADDYMPKPFNFQVLESRIRNLIAMRKNLQALFSKKNLVKASEIQVTSLDEQFIQKIIQIIEQNISNADLTVVDLSRELGVSRAQFFKKVQALTGKSPLELMRTIRLQQAAQLLEKSQLSVSEIAYKVGFNHPKYFARYFKELYDVLPSAYAKGKRKS